MPKEDISELALHGRSCLLEEPLQVRGLEELCDGRALDQDGEGDDQANVMLTIRGLSWLSGSERARARAKPPRSPPQVRSLVTPLRSPSRVRVIIKAVIGTYTLTARTMRQTRIAIGSVFISGAKGRLCTTTTIKPIITKSNEFNTSLIPRQNVLEGRSDFNRREAGHGHVAGHEPGDDHGDGPRHVDLERDAVTERRHHAVSKVARS